MKALIITAILIGFFFYALAVASSRAGDRETYMRYEEWKKKKESNNERE